MTAFSQTCNVAILAGGMGTRLRSRTGNLPKPMAPILGRPVLEHLINLCAHHGFQNIALLVHYEHETIRAHFGDGDRFGVRLRYCVETKARGTAGALFDALSHMDERFLVLYGDTYADVNLRRFWQAHVENDADATLLLHPNDHPHDSDLVEVGSNGQILAVHPYPHPESKALANLVNAALYAMNRKGLDAVIPVEGRFDLAKHTFPAMLAAGWSLQAYVTPEYIKDMGTPERLDKVERDVIAGLPERLSGRQLRTAVFLDRDGTLNREINHLSSPDKLELLPDVGDAIRRLNRSGILAVCVTNQPVLARGDVTESEMSGIHAKLDFLLGQSGSYLDALYLCPHHPDAGFDGEVPGLKILCDCRKPATGLIDHAVRDLYISRRSSWFVGDTTSDIKAGHDSGLLTILVRTGHAGRDQKCSIAPDYVMPDLPSAVDWILRGHNRLLTELLPVLTAAQRARLILVGGVARAGKSTVTQGLKEHLEAIGRSVHVISLDAWLSPVGDRPEGLDVLQCYNMNAVCEVIENLLSPSGRVECQLPIHDRDRRSSQYRMQFSTGPVDAIIVEGVPALLDSRLVDKSDLRLYVDVSDHLREQRLHIDCALCADDSVAMSDRLTVREKAEASQVRASSVLADFVINGSNE